MTEEVAAPEASGAEPVAAPVETPTAPPTSARESVSKALSGLYDDAGDVREEAPATDVKPAEKPSSGPQRGADGKFMAKEPPTDAGEAPKDEAVAEAKPEAPKAVDASDAPAGFDAAAKAAWAGAPAELKGAVTRRLGELETGLRAYQQDFGGLREFAQLAKSQGQTPAAVVNNYVAIEKQLASDPIKGLSLIAQNMGMDLRQVAAHIAGQPAPERDAVIDELKRELADLKRGFGGVQQTIQDQRNSAIGESVKAFAAAHPRFDELGDEIARMLSTGYASSLEDAYAKAERLNPLPPAPQPAVRTPEQQAAQTRKASLAVTGAPVAGSNPATRKPPSSARDAVRNALGNAGL